MRYKEHILPTEPHTFCEVYRDSRKNTHNYENPDVVLRINFEDMIYHYDESISKVCNFVGVDFSQHKYPKKYFNPEVSINNTRFWEKYPEFRGAVEIIEKDLPEFLYRYE